MAWYYASMNTEAVFDRLCLVVREAGIVAKMFQGHVRNEGKTHDAVTENESERLQALRSAKTLVDEVVQEIILNGLLEILPPGTALDAEEDTPRAQLFTREGQGATLVLDPIDGTLEYLEGRDDYSICVALVEKGRMLLALVFFPARDFALAIAPDGKAYEYEKFGTEGTKNTKLIVLPPAEKVVYKNSRVPEEVVRAIQAKDYSVLDDQDNHIGASEAMFAIRSGKACAYVASTRQIRDILVGAILAKAEGGYASDWEGNPLVWPDGGRVPKAIFGNSAAKDFIPL